MEIIRKPSRLAIIAATAAVGISSIFGLGGCYQHPQSDPYEGFTPEQRQACRDYMEQRNEQIAASNKASMEYMSQPHPEYQSQRSEDKDLQKMKDTAEITGNIARIISGMKHP